MGKFRASIFFLVPFVLALSLSSEARAAAYEGALVVGRALRRILDINNVLPGVFG